MTPLVTSVVSSKTDSDYIVKSVEYLVIVQPDQMSYHSQNRTILKVTFTNGVILMGENVQVSREA